MISLKNTEKVRKGVYLKPYNEKVTNINDDMLRNTEKFGCSKEIKSAYSGSYCGGLIEYNNWKIPKDYPIKF